MKKWFIASIISLISMILTVIFIFIFWNDEKELGDNYYYLPLYEAYDVGHPGGAIIYKSPQEYWYKDVKVRGNVLSVDSDKDFIIAIRKKGNTYSYIESNNTIDNDTLQYYIIVKKTDSVYGPYNKEYFLLKKEELEVSKRLTVEYESE